MNAPQDDTPEAGGKGEVRVWSRELGVVLERRAAKSRWLKEVWRVVDVLPGAPDMPAGTVLLDEPGAHRWYAGAYKVSLYAGETKNYKFNLESPAPKAYVILRRKPGGEGDAAYAILAVTLDPLEAHAHADTGDDMVEAVALHAPLRAWMAEFVARFHVERTVWKRKRDKADPESMASRPRAGREGGETSRPHFRRLRRALDEDGSEET